MTCISGYDVFILKNTRLERILRNWQRSNGVLIIFEYFKRSLFSYSEHKQMYANKQLLLILILGEVPVKVNEMIICRFFS